MLTNTPLWTSLSNKIEEASIEMIVPIEVEVEFILKIDIRTTIGMIMEEDTVEAVILDINQKINMN